MKLPAPLLWFGSVACLSLLLACGRGDTVMASAAPESLAAAPVVAQPPGAPEPDTAVGAAVSTRARSLVVTLRLSVVVDDVAATARLLRDHTRALGGYVGDSSASGEGAQQRGEMVLRVPVGQAADVRATLSRLGRIVGDQESAVDVTDEVADLEARLRNARAQEARILDIMTHKTGSIAEVLAAEAELGRVRESVERLDAQQRTLGAKVQLATVYVSLVSSWTPAAPTAAVDTPWASIVASGRAGVLAARTALIYVAMAAAASAPFVIPMVLLLAWVLRRARRRRGLATAQR